MIFGQFRDGFARIGVELPLVSGGVRIVEFVLDSGFDGDLSLPPALLPGLNAQYAGERPFGFADLIYRSRPVYRVLLAWEGEERIAEVAAMDGNPLLGLGMVQERSVQFDVTEGGDVFVGPLD